MSVPSPLSARSSALSTTAGGVPVYGKRSFADIRPSISDDDVLSVGTALAGLQTRTLGKVMRQDTAVLVEA